MSIADPQHKAKLPYAPNAVISGVIGREDDDEKGRFYIRPSDDLRLISTTHVLDRTGDQTFVKGWYSKLAGQLIAKRFGELALLTAADAPAKAAADWKKAHKGREPDDETLREIARSEWMKRELQKLSKIQADIGSHQHHILEALVLDEPIPDVPEHLVNIEVNDEQIDHDELSDGLLQFFADHTDAVVEMAEATVANPELGTAGTLDLIVYFPRGITIKGVTYYRLLIDLKAGKWLKVDMRRQLAAYRFSTEIWLDWLGNTAPMPAVDGAAVLHLRKSYDQGYKLIIVDASPEAYDSFVGRVQRFIEAAAEHDATVNAWVLGDIAYPPLPDGSQPLPMIEDIADENVKGFGRCRTPLRRAGLRRLEELATFTEADVKAVKGMGDKTIEVCRMALAQFGLSFAHHQGEN